MGIAAGIRAGDEAIGAWLDHAFAPAANPWRHLGSLAFLFLAVCVASGIYAYALFDTSVAGAYESGRALTSDPHYAGRLARGLHRYSADAFALLTALHLVREAARGHFRHFRAWSWLSGVVLVPLAWIAGVTGFWLAWDERALFSAMASAEWIAAWPFGAAAFARDFAAAGPNDRFFSLAIFLHIGVPLMTLAATWAHFLRLAHVRAWPPRALGAGAIASLAVLSLAVTPASLGPADTLAAPADVAIDWFYLFPHAIADWVTPAGLSVAAFAAAAAAIAMPWMGAARRPAPAVVDLANCNGCSRCAADCPFGAVVMVARSDARPHPREARVLPDLCAACGICTGACPSSTPFRRRARLASGIDLPQLTVEALRERLDHVLDTRKHPVIVFTCTPSGAPIRESPRVAEIAAECTAMIPPAFVEYALRAGAAGVVVAGCRTGDCEFRLGDRWSAQRIARARAPFLRLTVDRERLRIVDGGSDRAAVERAVQSLLADETSHA